MDTQLTIEKIVSGGRGLAHHDGTTIFVDGALPGEVVKARLEKGGARWAIGQLQSIEQPSQYRQTPHEAHYFVCSPWQAVDYSYQLELKQTILKEIFDRPGLELPVLPFATVNSPLPALGYRNKLEFAVVADDAGQLSLQLHQRGSHEAFVAAPDGCVLGTPEMNQMVVAVLQRMNAMAAPDVFKSVIIRKSLVDNALMVVIMVEKSRKQDWQRLVVPGLDNLIVALVQTDDRPRLLWSRGNQNLTEASAVGRLDYGWNSFYQVNPAAFELALPAIVEAVPTGSRVADLYGGVGVIGLAVAGRSADVLGIEVDPAAVVAARANAARLNIANYRVTTASAELLTATHLLGRDVVIVDPPRSGLHERTIASLMAASPAVIVYVSCDPVTQARDITRLQEQYVAQSVQPFDFYPGTPHMETLVVLHRR